MTEKIIFLVRSGAIFKISFGHLYRCLIICNELRKIKNFNPLFITNKDLTTKKILDNHTVMEEVAEANKIAGDAYLATGSFDQTNFGSRLA